MRPSSLRARPRSWLAVLAAVAAIVACGPPDFVVHVTYPGPVDIQPGAPVLYQGVRVGHVESVSLDQGRPDAPARVRLTLAITDPGIRLREEDRFHLHSEGMWADGAVEVVPAPASSPPLEAGATVAGVPPVVTQVEDAVESAADSLSELVSEALRQAAETIRGIDPSAPPPPAPAPQRPQPAPAPRASPQAPPPTTP